MEPEGWHRLRELFAAAVRLDAGERSAFLDRACGDDAELRRELESLLAHDAEGGADRRDPIGEAVGAAAARVVGNGPDLSRSPLIGRRIGKIRVLKVLGEGGMGEVYAGYDEGLERRVAVKALRERDRLAPEARARFLREARILSQLDHPNICRIHELVEGDDEDFLVLELIEGETLAETIDEGLTPAGKMKVALQIAQVLEAAHGKGVVHRDLKPQNVMVTPEGETKVLDFGLARSAEPSPAPSGPPGGGESTGTGPSPADLAGPLHTRQGQILGSPVYMSPEQAAGERATTASDMYSFGLLLQRLFTGDSPYPRDLGSDEVLARARHGESLPAVGIDKDLSKLIERLKSVAPAARPTAVEALERLRWIRDKPTRRLRRWVAVGALVLVAAGVGKYTFDLKIARDEAAARRVQAEGLLGFLLEDLRTSLEPLGRLDILDAVGDRAMEYFAAAPRDSLSDEELSKQAQALTQIGDVRVSQLRYDEALAAFEAAYARALALSQRQPEDAERLFDRGQAEYWVGNTHFLRGAFEPAGVWFQRYLETSEALVELDGRREEWAREVAYGHHNLAVLALERGELEAAATAFQEEIDVLGALLQQVSKETASTGGDLSGAWALKEDLADAYSWQGAANQRRGDSSAASRAFQRSSGLFLELVAQDPENLHWRFWNAFGKVLEAQVASVSGEVSRAERLLAEGTTALDRLVAADPGNRRWRRARASARIDLAEVLFHLGRDEEALNQVQAGGDELGELLTLEPSDRKSLQFRIRSWRTEARLHRRGRRPEPAQAALSRARAAAAEALEGAGLKDPVFLAELASTLVLAGQLQADRGNRAAARRSWSEVLVLLGGEMGEHPQAHLLDPWIRAKILLGEGDQARSRIDRLFAAGYRPLRPWPEDPRP